MSLSVAVWSVIYWQRKETKTTMAIGFVFNYEVNWERRQRTSQKLKETDRLRKGIDRQPRQVTQSDKHQLTKGLGFLRVMAVEFIETDPNNSSLEICQFKKNNKKKTKQQH